MLCTAHDTSYAYIVIHVYYYAEFTNTATHIQTINRARKDRSLMIYLKTSC